MDAVTRSHGVQIEIEAESEAKLRICSFDI